MKKREPKLGQKAKAVLGPMAKLLPKPMMKTVKAWALVSPKGICATSTSNRLIIFRTRRCAEAVSFGERIARVVITEVVKG